MNKLLISLLETVYLIYMFHFFTTTVDFNIFESPGGELFKHIIGNQKGLRICPFGRVVIFVLIFILISRNFIFISPLLIKITLIISFILSFMNLNAVIYMLPIFIIEYYI